MKKRNLEYKVVKFNNDHLIEMAKLFVEEYSEPDKKWSPEKAGEYLRRDIDSFPDYCFAAVGENGKCLGAIFCRIDPYYDGYMLFIDSLQVREEYRKTGIAKELFRIVLKRAKEENLLGVHLLADAREGFPRSWYEKIGFELSGWAEYEVMIEDIDLL